DRIMSLLTEFGLEKRAKDKVGTYSKGMKQSLALARALLHKPKVLFLDEPTSSLDPVAARHVNDLIERLTRREGCTVFLCTHNLVEAQKLCDRVAVMQHGQLKALGTPADLTRQYIKRQNIELEVEENQIEKTNQILVSHPDLVLRTPVLEKNMLLVTVSGRDAIPEILTLLTVNNISVYRLNPQEVNLEEVYFALNGESK
ncbi:MAG: ABC transporter ATP-binding protein, partial [Chloroflexi bacterium HGW-Chloroflexi-8]